LCRTATRRRGIDGLLRGHEQYRLADGGKAGIQIGLPEVVVREATSELRRELEDRVPRAAKLTDELRKLLVDAEICFDVETVVSN
jgi:hypothetical protein